MNLANGIPNCSNNTKNDLEKRIAREGVLQNLI